MPANMKHEKTADFRGRFLAEGADNFTAAPPCKCANALFAKHGIFKEFQIVREKFVQCVDFPLYALFENEPAFVSAIDNRLEALVEILRLLGFVEELGVCF